MLEAKREKEAFAARIKREKESRDRLAARKKADSLATELANRQAAAETAAARAKYIAEEAEARVRLQKVLEAEDEGRTPRSSRMSDAELKAAAKRMRDRWNAHRKASAPPCRAQTDPYAEWRGTSGPKISKPREARRTNDEDDEEEVVPEEATEEELALLMARKAKARERDLAARRVLAHGSHTLMDAIGLPTDATDAEVQTRVRQLLRLLHPDYSINLSIKGTRRHRRIEAAFKRLNGLRDE